MSWEDCGLKPEAQRKVDEMTYDESSQMSFEAYIKARGAVAALDMVLGAFRNAAEAATDKDSALVLRLIANDIEAIERSVIQQKVLPLT